MVYFYVNILMFLMLIKIADAHQVLLICIGFMRNFSKD